jgi:hypothetical protein
MAARRCFRRDPVSRGQNNSDAAAVRPMKSVPSLFGRLLPRGAFYRTWPVLATRRQTLSALTEPHEEHGYRHVHADGDPRVAVQPRRRVGVHRALSQPRVRRLPVRRRQGSDDVVAKLRPFHGTLTADAEHRFNAVYASGHIVEAGCNAHGRRKFRDAEPTQPRLAGEGGAFLGAIYGEEEKAQKKGLAGEALLAHRRTNIRPIAEKFERWLKAVEPTLLPSEPLMVAVQYYRRHRDALFRFLDDPDVPIDNSPTEREFQNVAKLRLNMLFAGSTEGAHRACVLLGIIATCRALGAPIQPYLAWAFDRLGTHRDACGLSIEDITPAAFKKTLG